MREYVILIQGVIHSVRNGCQIKSPRRLGFILKSPQAVVLRWSKSINTTM